MCSSLTKFLTAVFPLVIFRAEEGAEFAQERLGDDARVFEFLKRFQTTIVTHDGFGDGKACYAGNRHAVSRVALGIVNIGRESAEVGGEVGGNVAFAAP